MNLFIAPHNDDESLFGAFTLMREKPLVVIVTDSWIQRNRGENISADQRWQETVNAMKVIGLPVIRLGIRDDVADEWAIREKLMRFAGFDKVFAPAVQGGNKDHDLIGEAAKMIFGDTIVQYSTYAKDEFYTPGSIKIEPTPEEIRIKNAMLACYTSQLSLPTTKPHFEAVQGQPEWLV